MKNPPKKTQKKRLKKTHKKRILKKCIFEVLNPKKQVENSIFIRNTYKKVHFYQNYKVLNQIKGKNT